MHPPWEIEGDRLRMNVRDGQSVAIQSRARFIFMRAGSPWRGAPAWRGGPHVASPPRGPS
jgi:hypothetical protein